jgi:hypothetical protein
MSESERPAVKLHVLFKAVNAVKSAATRFFTRVLIPVASDIWHVLRSMLRPVVHIVSHGTAVSLRTLHNKKHWSLRFRTTFWGNAVGLAIAMISAQVITNFIEIRGVENMWGLFSKRTVVSETSFRVLSFIVEFIVTLLVFSVIEYFLDQRALRKQSEAIQHEDVFVDD